MLGVLKAGGLEYSRSRYAFLFNDELDSEH